MTESILQGDCLIRLKQLPDNSIDAVVTDPPYGLGEIRDLSGLLTAWMEGRDGKEYQSKGFMGKHWDTVPAPIYWKEIYRVLKPGGHLLAFAGTRTQDLMGISIRFAGFELRDTIEHLGGASPLWIYGSGFPKGLDVSKKIDELAGAEREIIHYKKQGPKSMFDSGKPRPVTLPVTLPATLPAKAWEGWNVALKPSQEPILMFRKPLEHGLSVAKNVLKWGTGAINIGACRVQGTSTTTRHSSSSYMTGQIGSIQPKQDDYFTGRDDGKRWPSNLLLSHSLFCTETECTPDCPVRVMDSQSGLLKSGDKKLSHNLTAPKFKEGKYHDYQGHKVSREWEANEGGASRFFPQFRYSSQEIEDVYALFLYCAKASQSERNQGLEGLKPRRKVYNGQSGQSSTEMKPVEERFTTITRNHHPTVKSQELMRWLCRLITPPGGTVLDPFAGSGSTLIAAYQENFNFIGIEQEPEYCEIARLRLAAQSKQLKLEDLLTV